MLVKYGVKTAMGNAILWLLVIAAGLLFFVVPYFMPGITLQLAVLLVVVIIAALKYFNVKYVKAFPLSKKGSMYAAIVSFLLFGYFGGMFAGIIPTFAGLPAATIEPGVTPSQCMDIANELGSPIGDTATLTINNYDRESNTPYSSTVDALIYVYKNGEFIESTDTIAAKEITKVTVGDVVDIYGGNASYYVDYKSICIDREEKSVELDSHAAAAESNLQITAYDDTGTTELSSPSGTYSSDQEDYELSIGADGEETFYTKLKVNSANKAFNLMGVAAKTYEGVADTIDNLELVGNDMGLSFTSKPVPKFLANTVISLNDSTTTSNTTDGHNLYWELSEPVLLREWETIKLQWSVEAGGTDPEEDDDAAPTSESLVIIQFVDAVWQRDASDGQMYMSTHTIDSSEDNVGLSETVWSPLGKQSAVVIELA